MRLTSLKVGLLIGLRQIQRTNRWITLLIIFIMTLTFIFLVAITGILVGIIEGGNRANRNEYTGDVIITTLAGEEYIEKSESIKSTLATIPEVTGVTARYIESATIEANYTERRRFDELPDLAGTQLTGIDVIAEDNASQLSESVVEGRYLDPNRHGEVLIGANLLRRYSSGFGDGFDSIENVYPGDRVRIKFDDVVHEMEVVGIVDSKVGEVSIRAFIPKSEFLRITRRTNLNANEIAIFHDGQRSDQVLKQKLIKNNFDRYGKIQTATEAIPQFLVDIRFTFKLLGNLFGGIGLVVAVITIFIIVFINAITRKKYIGILKAIGIKRNAIEIAYVVQSLFYAVLGSAIGLAITYGLLVPSFQRYPLDFPFSDGILVAPLDETVIKLAILLFFTILAGFIPAWIITRRNTLASITGR